MLSLPEITGKYSVGATDFLLPLPSPSIIGKGRIQQDGSCLKPALVLEEVAFTAFYPTEPPERKYSPLSWLTRPVGTALRGYTHFSHLSKLYTWMLWPLLYLYGSRIKIPVSVNAPLLSPSSSDPKSTLQQWPLVIFSHGLGGTRTAYSQICARIAASGRVVLAIEHREGSGSACVWKNAQGEKKTLLYIRDDSVEWDEVKVGHEGRIQLRTDQLEFRRREIYLAYNAMRSLVDGRPPTLKTEGRPIDWASWTGPLPPVKVDRDITLAGHSFGGATIMSVLSNPPPEPHAQIPVTHALIHDPWVEPFTTGNPIPYSNSYSSEPSPLTTSSPSSPGGSSTDVSTATLCATPTPDEKTNASTPRMLVLNSEAFTLWEGHFERVLDVVRAWEPAGRRVITMLRTEHITFSDFPLLPLIRRATAQPLMDLIARLSLAFLDDRIDEALASGEVKTREMEVEVIGKKDGKRKLVGDVGDVIVH